MAEQGELDKRRRDLYAISLGLLAYNLSAGVFKHDATVGFGAIDVHRVWVLELGAWTAWAYFMWQFWLVARPVWKGFHADVDSEVQISRLFQSHCRRLFEFIAEVARGDQATRYFRDRNGHDLEEAAKAMEANIKRKFTFKIEEGSRARKFAQGECIRPDLASSHQAVYISDQLWEQVLAKHRWTTFMRLRAFWMGCAKAAWRRHEFSTRVLPLLVAFLAPFAALARFGWHIYRPYYYCP